MTLVNLADMVSGCAWAEDDATLHADKPAIRGIVVEIRAGKKTLRRRGWRRAFAVVVADRRASGREGRRGRKGRRQVLFRAGEMVVFFLFLFFAESLQWHESA